MKIENEQLINHLFGYFIYVTLIAINLHNVVSFLQKGNNEGWMLLSMFNLAYWVAIVTRHAENWKSRVL